MSQKLIQYSYKLKKQKQHTLGFIFITLLSVFIVLNLIIKFLIFPVRQTSISMEPDFPQQSMIMVSPLVKNYVRGDVVLLNQRMQKDAKFYEMAWNSVYSFFTAKQFSYFEKDDIPSTKEELRRVVGLPGDTIYMKDYILYVKPQGQKHFLSEFEISEHTYNLSFCVSPAEWDNSIGVKGTFDEIKLKDNEYFVLSDNRKTSDDSRLWGAITSDKIKAKVLICYFPFNKFKIF